MCLEQFKTPDWITLDFIRNQQPSVPRSQYASKGTFALPLPAVFPGKKRTQAGHLSDSDSLSISSRALQPQGSSLLRGSGKDRARWLWLRLYGVPQPHAQGSDILTCTGCQHAGSDGGREGQGRAQGGIDNSGDPGFQHPPANGASSLGALPTAHRALVEEERISELKSYELESNACPCGLLNSLCQEKSQPLKEIFTATYNIYLAATLYPPPHILRVPMSILPIPSYIWLRP